VKTIYLADPVYTTLAIEVDEHGACVEGWGVGRPGEFFGLTLTDTERLLLAAALLREGESVTGVSEVAARMETKNAR
jgi:hypothetical protein